MHKIETDVLLCGTPEHSVSSSILTNGKFITDMIRMLNSSATQTTFEEAMSFFKTPSHNISKYAGTYYRVN